MNRTLDIFKLYDASSMSEALCVYIYIVTLVLLLPVRSFWLILFTERIHTQRYRVFLAILGHRGN